jgi:Inner membrane component of T3SS, cytoplasmic domain
MSSTADDVQARAGHPRLVVATEGHVLAGTPEAAGIQQSFALRTDRVTIGSADTQDIRLAGLEPEHGVIQRDGGADEWVYSDVRAETASRVDGVIVEASGLHHGDRLELGDVTLVFQRDETADHGRPDSGRQGGDFAGGGSAGGGGEATEQG